MWNTSQRRRVREELEAHIGDLASEFVERGYSDADARTAAEQQFGDAVAVENALVTRSLDARVVLGVTYALAGSALITALFSVREPVLQAQIQWAVFVWACLSVIAAVLVCICWAMEFYGMHSGLTLWVAVLLTLLVSMVVTLVLDIDNFEVNIHAIGLGGLLLVVGGALWSRFSVRIQQMLLYGYATAVTYSTLVEEPLFSFVGTARCLFLTPDAVPLTGVNVHCQQVSLLSGMLFPAYLFLLLGIPFLLKFLFTYVRDRGPRLYRKLSMSAVVFALPLMPLFVSDVNNYGELDILRWKADIYEAYHDVLGRSPEQKDIDFYATTRSYEHMEVVREVLYQSYERRLKIDLLHQEELGRHATEEEIAAYVERRITAEDIRSELQQRSAAERRE